MSSTRILQIVFWRIFFPPRLRVSKSCPRLLINMEKAGQVSPRRRCCLTPCVCGERGGILSDVFMPWAQCHVLFFLQADPMLGLLGFGGGMDFDSEKAYRYYRDRFSLSKKCVDTNCRSVSKVGKKNYRERTFWFSKLSVFVSMIYYCRRNHAVHVCTTSGCKKITLTVTMWEVFPFLSYLGQWGEGGVLVPLNGTKEL